MTSTTSRPRSDIRSRSLDLLRYPLALAVLLTHIQGVHPAIMKEHLPWLGKFIDIFLSNMSVPAFFFIAGYLFFFRTTFTREVYLRKMRTRIYSLLIPYIAWNLLALAVHYLQGKVAFSGISSLLVQLRYAMLGYPGELSYPADAPMWFVRDLMLVALASPVLAWLFRHRCAWCIILFGIIWANPDTRHIWSWQMETAIFFFSWGAWMSFDGKDRLTAFQRFRWSSLIVYLLNAIIAFVIYNTHRPAARWCMAVAVLAALVVAFNLAGYLAKRGYGRLGLRLAPAAFFLYCSHIIILKPIGDIAYQAFTIHNTTMATMYYAIVTIATAGISTAAFFAMRRYAPRVLAPFVGGRL